MSLQKVSYTYPDSKRPDLQDVYFELLEGQSVLLTGPSGSGKSTLLRVMGGLAPRFYGGRLHGQVKLLGQDLDKWPHRDLCRHIGILFQDPESQLVTTRVDQELVFGMENVGYARDLMQDRLQEIAAVFAMQSWLYCPTLHLSGGWKQMTVLASIMAVRPRLLLLDEPLSQLDADSADQFLDYLDQCRRHWGMAVVIAEHRLDKLAKRVDKVLYINQGKVQAQPTDKISWLVGYQGTEASNKAKRISAFNKGQRVAGLRSVDFWYTHAQQPVLKQLSLDLQAGEITCLMGANGAGKTTLLKLLLGTIKPCRGQVDICGENPYRMPALQLARKVGYLSQEPGDYLFSPTVRQEVEFTYRSLQLKDYSRINRLLERLHLQPLAHRNPRDLSWGERQRTALASILVAQPQVLLLDEPTRGLDYRLKNDLAVILRDLANQGTAILVATHDQYWANTFADQLLYLQQGTISDTANSNYSGEEMLEV
ncbi:MAG TPA: ABC transporter ATP-binding protein [Syntrophomonadaceae bacterium]|nr:ABC transporter ATP-binding protein [Syntrophomonadaceae bacterium]